MRSFLQYLLEQNTEASDRPDWLFRVDHTPLSADTKEYEIDETGNSGNAGANHGELRGSITRQHGLFADELHKVVPYIAGRDLPFVFTTASPDSKAGHSVYFRLRDRETIAARRPIISTFSSQGWKKLPSGEWFYAGKKTPKPVSVEVIDDPILAIEKHMKINWTDDLDAVRKQYSEGEHPGIQDITVNGGSPAQKNSEHIYQYEKF